MKTLKALIIEDDESTREALADAVISLHHEPHQAGSQEEAHEHLSNAEFDYVLLDLGLPVRRSSSSVSRPSTGLNLMNDIKKLAPNTDILIISGHSEVDVVVDAMKRGACDYATKPFTEDNTLEEKIRKLPCVSNQSGSNNKQATDNKFSGGELIFYDSHVEINGVRLANTGSIMFKIFDILKEQDEHQNYVGYVAKEIVDKMNAQAEDGIVSKTLSESKKRWKADFEEKDISIDRNDIILNKRNLGGYRINDHITVKDERKPKPKSKKRK